MREIAQEFSALDVTEIAGTICESLEWKQPGGGLKNHKCSQLLEQLTAEDSPRFRPCGSGGKGAAAGN
jgi:hypothetical protein